MRADYFMKKYYNFYCVTFMDYKWVWIIYAHTTADATHPADCCNC